MANYSGGFECICRSIDVCLRICRQYGILHSYPQNALQLGVYVFFYWCAADDSNIILANNLHRLINLAHTRNGLFLPSRQVDISDDRMRKYVCSHAIFTSISPSAWQHWRTLRTAYAYNKHTHAMRETNAVWHPQNSCGDHNFASRGGRMKHTDTHRVDWRSGYGHHADRNEIRKFCWCGGGHILNEHRKHPGHLSAQKCMCGQIKLASDQSSNPDHRATQQSELHIPTRTNAGLCGVLFLSVSMSTSNAVSMSMPWCGVISHVHQSVYFAV